MGACILKKSGGGTSSDDCTATLANVLEGKTAITSDSNDDTGTGTMTNRGAVSSSLSAGGSYTITKGYHNGSGVISAKSLSSQTSATATSARILSGYTAWVNGSQVTGSISSMSGGTYTPTASSRTISCSGRYMTSNIIISGDSNLTGANIVSGKSIFGVSGTSSNIASVPDGALYYYGSVVSYTTSSCWGYTLTGSGHYITFVTNNMWLASSAASGYSSVRIVFNGQAFNMSNYSKLNITATHAYGNSYFDTVSVWYGTTISTSSSDRLGTISATFETSNSIGSTTTCAIDVSSLTGTYYLGLSFANAGLNYTADTVIDRIWLS